MSKLQFICVVLFLFMATTINAQNVISEQSLVNFAISAMKIKKVKGTFTGMRGTVFIDRENVMLQIVYFVNNS